jgi:hypothetical protein
MDMRFSKMIIGDWMSAPNLPEKRTLVIQTAVGVLQRHATVQSE